MPHARNEITENEQPLSDAKEPAVDMVHALLSKADMFSIAIDKSLAQGSPNYVAERNTAYTARESREEGQPRLQTALRDEIAREHQQRLIRDRKPHNTQHQQSEQ